MYVLWKRKWCSFYILFILAVLAGIGILSRSVSVMAENQAPEREICIIVDPGHGGEDGGAISVSGKAESGYNLAIAMRLNDLLHLLGYETRMTRTSDISVYTKGGTLAQKKVSDLKERVRICNEPENALLLSIHQNFYPDERYAGPQVFYAPTEGSSQLAKQLQHVLSAELRPGSSRGAKKAGGIYLMEHVRCPAVLIECGFLSNYPEEAALRNPEYQKQISGLIAAAVAQYLSKT